VFQPAVWLSTVFKIRKIATNALYYTIRFLQLKHYNSGMYRPHVGHNHSVQQYIYLQKDYKQNKLKVVFKSFVVVAVDA